MRLLLNTDVFLWYVSDDPRLTQLFSAAIREPSNEAYLSSASIWEAVIKPGLGKLPLPEPPADYLPRQRESHGIVALPIDEGAMSHLAGLPLLRRDPFDRILVAQAIQHRLTIVTVDPEVNEYPIAKLSPV